MFFLKKSGRVGSVRDQRGDSSSLLDLSQYSEIPKILASVHIQEPRLWLFSALREWVTVPHVLLFNCYYSTKWDTFYDRWIDRAFACQPFTRWIILWCGCVSSAVTAWWLSDGQEVTNGVLWIMWGRRGFGEANPLGRSESSSRTRCEVLCHS